MILGVAWSRRAASSSRGRIGRVGTAGRTCKRDGGLGLHEAIEDGGLGGGGNVDDDG